MARLVLLVNPHHALWQWHTQVAGFIVIKFDQHRNFLLLAQITVLPPVVVTAAGQEQLFTHGHPGRR